jgi:UDP-N-acetylmuramyl tripeptide synthase
MPILEFRCTKGHITEKLFLTFSAAENINTVICPVCNHSRALAQRIISLPGQAILYGEGFYKPAASGNNSYRRGDPSKAVKELGRGQGLKGLEKTVNE